MEGENRYEQSLCTVPGTSPADTQRMISLVSAMPNDRDMLRFIVDVGKRADAKPIERIHGIIAETMIRVKMRNGQELLFPVSALLARNLTGNCLQPTSTEDDGTLFALSKRLNRLRPTRDRLQTAINLGDRAVHFLSGMGTKSIRRVMSDQALTDYAAMAAYEGYGDAEIIADYIGGKTSDVVGSLILPLKERLPDAVKVFRELLQRELETFLQ